MKVRILLLKLTLVMSFQVFGQNDSLIIEKYKDDSSEYVIERIGYKERHFKRFYLNGKPREEYTQVNGLLNGKFFEWYENGQLKAVQWYIYGIEAGTWLSYYANGVLKEMRKYSFSDEMFFQKPIVDTVLINKQFYGNISHYDTMLLVRYNIPDFCINFYPNGVKEREEEYLKRKKHGLWKYYNALGELIRQEQYENGHLITKKR